MEPQRLLNRNFVLLSQGQFVSQLGWQLSLVASLFWIKHETGSATLVGLLGVAGALPGLIFGPLSGALVDRLSRRAIVIWGDLLRGLSMLPIALLALFAPHEKPLILGGLFAAMVVSSIVQSFFEPAISAALPDLVPPSRLGAANSVSLSLTRLTGLLGPALGATAFRVLGAPILFLVDAVASLVSAATECFIRIPGPEPQRTRGGFLRTVKSDMLEGFGYIWSRRGLRSLFVLAGFMNFLIAPIVILLPFYVEETLEVRVDWYGFMMAAFGFGSLAGYALAASVRTSPATTGKLLMASLVGIALSCGLLAVVTAPLLAIAMFFVFGSLTGLFNVSTRTILQTSTPSHMRGRVFAVLGTMARALAPLAMALAGFAADATGHDVPTIYAICGIGLVLVSVTAALNREARRFLSSGTAQARRL